MKLTKMMSDNSERLAIHETINSNVLASFALFQIKLDCEQTNSRLKQLQLENTLMEQELYQTKIELYESKLKLRLSS